MEFRAPLDSNGNSLTLDDVSLVEVTQEVDNLVSVALERQM